jgi:hypothetical protein
LALLRRAGMPKQIGERIVILLEKVDQLNLDIESLLLEENISLDIVKDKIRRRGLILSHIKLINKPK